MIESISVINAIKIINDVPKYNKIIKDFVDMKYNEMFPNKNDIPKDKYSDMRYDFEDNYFSNRNVRRPVTKDDIEKAFVFIDSEFKKVTWNNFNRFEILGDRHIVIHFQYGWSNVGLSASFIVDLLPEIRNEKIDKLLNENS